MIQNALSTEEKNWAMAAHLSALIAMAGLPFGHVVGPLIVYLVKGGQSEFVARHGRASLNYQITVSLAAIVLVAIAVVLFVVFAFAIGASTGESHVARASDEAAGLGFVAIWIVAILAVVVFVVVSLIFIILGTVAASEGRPYRYPFAITFIREPQ